MIRWRWWIAIACLFWLKANAAAGPDVFELVGSITSNTVHTIALDANRLVGLGNRQVLVIPTSAPGQNLRANAAIDLEFEYAHATLDNDRVYLFSPARRLAIVDLGSPSLALAETTLADSVFAAVARRDTLYAALGLDGIGIFDCSDPANPLLLHRLLDGAYYTKVALRDRWLIAIDALNGVDIFDLDSSSPNRLSTILLDRAPLDLASVAGGFAVCDGSEVVTIRELLPNGTAPISGLLSCEFAVSLIAADSTRIIASGKDGISRLVDFETGDLDTLIRSGFPILDLAAAPAGENAEFAICDFSGNVKLIEISPTEDMSARHFVSDASVSAATSSQNALLYCDGAGGLNRLAAEGIFPEPIAATGYADQIAAEAGFVFLAATNAEEVRIYEYDRFDRLAPVLNLPIIAPLRELLVTQAGLGRSRLVVAHVDGASIFLIDPVGLEVTIEAEVPVDFEVASAALSDSLLLLANDRGEAVLLALNSFNGELTPISLSTESPRRILFIEDQYVVVAHRRGLDIFHVGEDTPIITQLPSPNSILSATDLLYMAEDRILVVADGEGLVRYLDFADPSSLSAVYPIAGSIGASRLSFSSERLFAFSPSRTLIFEKQQLTKNDAPQNQSLVLSPFYPNPFNTSTVAELSLSVDHADHRPLTLRVVNLLGQTVLSQAVPAIPGTPIRWNGVDDFGQPVASGVYFVTLSRGASQATRKVLLLK